MRSWLLALLALLGGALNAPAEVVTRSIAYKHADVALEGTLVYDPAASGKRPGVLLAHEAGATAPLTRQKAAMLAQLGYVIFTADLYGKGVQPRDGKEAAVKAGLLGKDRKALRARMQAGLEVLRQQKNVDADNLAAVGYGVGGTAVLELARAGAELEGVVCLHGDVSTPTPEDAKKISASVLVIVGTDDPLVTPKQLAALDEEMHAGGVDWQVLRLGGVVHDFTNPQAGRDLKKGRAYDGSADKRAAEAVRVFLAEQFPPPARRPAPKPTPAATAKPSGIPEKVLKVLKHVDEEQTAPKGYEGGRNFLNLERLLPQKDSQGNRLKYREWDVNPLRPGVNRGAERLVTGSDGSAFYTDDHYRSFKKIR